MLICFDYDGVIVDSLEALLDLARRARTNLACGREPVADDFRRIEDLSFHAFAARIGVPANQQHRFGAEVMRLQAEAGAWDVEPFAGVAELLNDLGQAHDLTVITASNGAPVRASLTEFGLSGAIREVYGAERGGRKRERIGRAITEFSSTPESTWMVGDAISDIREGKAAGVRTAAVTWGYQYRELLDAEAPDALLDDLHALKMLFQR